MEIRFGILTVSDRSADGKREDLSGPALVKAVSDAGWIPAQTLIVPDHQDKISQVLMDWSDNGDLQVILTTGGTGFSPRDVTPEATLQIIDRRSPGIAEIMRAESLKITPHAMLSRAEAGIRKRTLIINLPGSPKGALENFRIVAPVIKHAVQLLTDDSQAEEGHQKTQSI